MILRRGGDTFFSFYEFALELLKRGGVVIDEKWQDLFFFLMSWPLKNEERWRYHSLHDELAFD